MIDYLTLYNFLCLKSIFFTDRRIGACTNGVSFTWYAFAEFGQEEELIVHAH